jgi:UDPglucose 6-dehydrogenase
MKIGMIGAGKLGTPVAVAMGYKGHSVMAYDVVARNNIDPWPHMEKGIEFPDPEGGTFDYSFDAARRMYGPKYGSLSEVVAHADIIFVSVQTPHDPAYEGVTRLPETRVDFDYSYLETAIKDLNAEIGAQGEYKTVIIISTMLPGTIRRRILPLIGPLVRLCYNPSFIAMGDVIRDYLHPEFVLFGVWDQIAEEQAIAFYRTITNAPIYTTSVENAEAIKVFYNTYISTKIAFANTVMEMCDKLPGCDVDAVMGGLSLAQRRLMSPAYMRGGMGDGGGCHPRDNIALSYLAQELYLSFDWFEMIMKARERQTEYIAQIAVAEADDRGLPIVILGKAFKPGTNITTGSPAILLANIIDQYTRDVSMFDPLVDAGDPPLDAPAVFVVATQHQQFACYPYPAQSVVIDPFRYVLDKGDRVTVIRVGAG